MSYSYVKAKKLIAENFNKDDILSFSKIHKSMVPHLEKTLHISLPKSFKYFIKDFGFGGPKSIMISGIRTNNKEEVLSTGIGWKIEKFRTEFDLPHHIILISDIGDGSYYALDLSQMNDKQECPVVVWPVGGYDETPELEIVAPDFGTWFLEQVEEQIRRHKRDAQ